jgi:hypothetical protein
LPEDKDLIVKNNTAAQHKHCKSLSPEQKVQVTKKNATVHERKYELIPPENKQDS